jgi:hypothetical protein
VEREIITEKKRFWWDVVEEGGVVSLGGFPVGDGGG